MVRSFARRWLAVVMLVKWAWLIWAVVRTPCWSSQSAMRRSRAVRCDRDRSRSTALARDGPDGAGPDDGEEAGADDRRTGRRRPVGDGGYPR
jgi:hypothetical protein